MHAAAWFYRVNAACLQQPRQCADNALLVNVNPRASRGSAASPCSSRTTTTRDEFVVTISFRMPFRSTFALGMLDFNAMDNLPLMIRHSAFFRCSESLSFAIARQDRSIFFVLLVFVFIDFLFLLCSFLSLSLSLSLCLCLSCSLSVRASLSIPSDVMPELAGGCPGGPIRPRDGERRTVSLLPW